MKHLHFPALLLLTALALSTAVGCRKNDDDDDDLVNVSSSETVQPSTYRTLDDVFRDAGVVARTYNINADSGGYFFAPQGTRVVLPKTPFTYAPNIVAHGTVQVTVREFLSRADMIFSRVLPVSGTTRLYTGGMVFLHATQGARTLQLWGGQSVDLFIPQNYGVPPAALVLQNGTFLDSTGGLNTVDWSPASSGSAGVLNDSVTISSTVLGYLAASEAYTLDGASNVTVRLNGATLPAPAPLNRIPTVATYLLPSADYAVYALPQPSGSAITGLNLPATDVYIASMTVVDGQFYAGLLNVSPESDKTYTVELKRTTPAEFRALIENINH